MPQVHTDTAAMIMPGLLFPRTNLCIPRPPMNTPQMPATSFFVPRSPRGSDVRGNPTPQVRQTTALGCVVAPHAGQYVVPACGFMPQLVQATARSTRLVLQFLQCMELC